MTRATEPEKTAALILRMMLGAPYRTMARWLGKDRKMVQYWTDPAYRARRNQKARAYYVGRAEVGRAQRKRYRAARTPEQRQRDYLRELARDEAREKGVAVQPIYEAWSCQ